MDAHPQPGGGSRGVHAAREGGAIGEHGRAGHYSVTKSLNDAAVYAVGPSEVIRIDNQILHSLACPYLSTCTFVQLLFRAPTRIRTIDRVLPQL